MSKLTRQIHIPGDTPLPPSADPVPPQNLPVNERFVVHPPVSYPDFSSDWFHFRSSQVMPRELLDAMYINEPEMFGRFYGHGKGLKGCTPPIWQVKVKTLKYPDFWVRGDLYVLSPRFKLMLDQHAPGAIEALPLRIETAEGNLVRDDYWVADVTLSIKGIDWANSIVAYEHVLGEVMPEPLKIVMRDEALGLAIFRDLNRPSFVFIHRNLYEVFANLAPKVTGTYFTQVW